MKRIAPFIPLIALALIMVIAAVGFVTAWIAFDEATGTEADFVAFEETFWRAVSRAGKNRIFEIYLNMIEWGDGIYGAEAASQYYFHKPAANLNAREAAFLSAMIPNPRTVFNPQVNPKRVARRQRIILRGMPSVKMPPGTG